MSKRTMMVLTPAKPTAHDRQTAEALDCLTSARRCVGRARSRAQLTAADREHARRADQAAKLVELAIDVLHEPHVQRP